MNDYEIRKETPMDQTTGSFIVEVLAAALAVVCLVAITTLFLML